jgi:hypothetical protein
LPRGVEPETPASMKIRSRRQSCSKGGFDLAFLLVERDARIGLAVCRDAGIAEHALRAGRWVV